MCGHLLSLKLPLCSLIFLWAAYTVWVPQMCGHSGGDGVLASWTLAQAACQCVWSAGLHTSIDSGKVLFWSLRGVARQVSGHQNCYSATGFGIKIEVKHSSKSKTAEEKKWKYGEDIANIILKFAENCFLDWVASTRVGRKCKKLDLIYT